MQQRKNRRLAARALNPRRKTREKEWPDNRSVYGSKKSLTQKPDDVSGKGRTKAKVLVVHRIGFVRSGVLSLIAKSMQFAVCGETDEAPLARELFLRHKPHLVVVGLRLCGADGIQLIKEFRSLIQPPQSSPCPSTLMRSRLNVCSGRVREHTSASRTLPNCSERSTRSQPATRTWVRACCR